MEVEIITREIRLNNVCIVKTNRFVVAFGDVNHKSGVGASSSAGTLVKSNVETRERVERKPNVKWSVSQCLLGVEEGERKGGGGGG